MTVAVASATLSITPTVTMDVPSTVTMNIGNRLWIVSEETSMNSEPNPSAQMPAGSARQLPGTRERGECLFEARTHAIVASVLRKRARARANRTAPIATRLRNCGHTTSNPAPR